MRQILDGLTLPRHLHFQQKPEPIFSKHVTLSTRLRVDTWGTRRAWVTTLPTITKAEYDAIYTKYLSQFGVSGAMLTYETTAEGADDLVIDETTVWMTLNDSKAVWAGSHIQGLEITLEEEYGEV